ncbi:HipA domain-containing protein [Microscilla marina]|uniref:HipA-like C-terminal domain-containing protein n=1 Tax=Microscilla marina ATCC 23134 TaxID=313606 RepID=A2A072_MICM2|nr:HipA domain-containing protein [Microscilla marina]EAY23961.1 conserved hypothetical protein [Microscilla marina ATCC 23134]
MVHKCPISYQLSQTRYSKPGLAKLSAKLTDLKDLPFTAQEQRQEAAAIATKMSIQGVQPKLSAKLAIAKQAFEVVDNGGTFIIKPQNDLYKEVPENEDVTMKMAQAFGIEVPLTGLVYSKDGSLSYFIKRFDRYGKNKKYHQEDFAQLTGNTRDTKYKWSMEKLIPVIEKYCTFPVLEKRKLFRRVLFCFLTGNEDMHLKNFSLITKADSITLSPAYDLLNSTIAMGKAVEETALPLAGKKSKFKKDHFFKYYAQDKLQLAEKTIVAEHQHMVDKKKELEHWINISFLSEEMKEQYLHLMENRYKRLI